MKFSFLLVLAFLASIGAQASLKIENWSSDLQWNRTEIQNLIALAAQQTSEQLSKRRNCQGRLVAAFVSHGSSDKTLKLGYQLSYNQSTCTNSLMVTCKIKVEATPTPKILSQQCRSLSSYRSAESEIENGGPSFRDGDRWAQEDFPARGDGPSDDQEPVRSSESWEDPGPGWL